MAELERNPEVAGGDIEVQQAGNELEAAAPEQEVPLALDETGLPQGVEWQEEDEPVPDKFADEEEEILFGPPEGIRQNRAPVETASATVPAKVARRLPALKRAAADPSAPESLRAMYRLLADRLESELRG
jgi:hypothetical protein